MWVIAGLQFCPMGPRRQLSDAVILAVLNVLAYPPVVSFHTLLPLRRAGFGWFSTRSDGKFCHTSRGWFSGQELM